jgi:ERCC4-related helicase
MTSANKIVILVPSYFSLSVWSSPLTIRTCKLSHYITDEAHKGKGDYAYAQVVRFMMAKNPHFHLLALTATPRSKPEAVQEIFDSLHISHIKIRDEESLDLRQYMFKKVGIVVSRSVDVSDSISAEP